ncbi:hypothetical protein ThidrDRAFT_1536 [Thiorhodococcus drewsii AZ1]|uniref:Uncharacterized protein n=1 Tax=Thiorhodococcus drewsii AZ1 TaxID=765913 RepID=G2DZS3_9GAMM|nr:hypothetical protein ThidrDRAFT_1536 [Thiorhodococcus drewsii AZ1]
MFNQSIVNTIAKGLLPTDEDHRIRVYLMHSTAKHNETARDRLKRVIGADAR